MRPRVQAIPRATEASVITPCTAPWGAILFSSPLGMASRRRRGTFAGLALSWAKRGATMCIGAVLAGLSAAPSPVVAAELMLFPTRVVFERNQRAAQVELVNNGSRTLTYRITLVERRMSETGEFGEAIPALPDERFASSMLRYSPRQVVLPPGASQVVRLMVRKPASLAAGEYRSHLQFMQIADTQPRPAADDTNGLSIQLVPLIGATIPVIVRHGSMNATAEVTDARLERTADGRTRMLSFSVRREGNRSLYGNVEVDFQPSEGGEPRRVVRVNGVAVYAPNALRRVRLELPAESLPATGTLHVVYRERAEDGARVIAETRLPLR